MKALTAQTLELTPLERPGRTVKAFVGPGEAENLAAGIVEFPVGTTAPPHSHSSQEELIYVVDGMGSIMLDHREQELEPGVFVFIPPGVVHQVRNNGPEPVRLLYAFSPPVEVGTWD